MALDQATLAATQERIREIQASASSEAAAQAQIAREAQEAFGSGAAAALAQATGMGEADIRRAASDVGAPLTTTSVADRVSSGEITREQAQELVNASVGLPASTAAPVTPPTRDEQIASQFYGLGEASIPEYVSLAMSQGYSAEDVARALGVPERAAEFQGYMDQYGGEVPPADLASMFPGLDLSGLELTGDVETDLNLLRAEYIKQATELAGREFQQYPGERVVGFTPAEQEARQRMLDLSQAGVGFPQVETALGVAGQVAGYTPSLLRDVDLEPYQTQYQEGVTDIALRELDRQRQMRQQDIAQQAIGASAFGGSRQGIVESELERTYAQQAGDIATRGAQAGLEYAQRGALADLAAQQAAPGIQLQGASALSQGANQLRAMGYSDAEVAQALGQSERALGQAEADVGYQTFLDAQAFPSQQLAYLTAPLGGSAVQQTAQIDQPSFIQSGLGTIGALGSTYNLLTGGTVFGGEGSLFGGQGSVFGNPFG